MLFEASYWRQNILRPDFEQGLQRADLKYLLEDWGRKVRSKLGQKGFSKLYGINREHIPFSYECF
jgi:hypothetical protein